MKKIFTFLVLTFLVLSVSATMKQSIADDDYRQAVYGALAKAEEPLKTAGFGKQPIAIVPLRRGHDLLAGRLKNMLNKAGFICVEGKEDPMWNKILAEIEWSDKKSGQGCFLWQGAHEAQGDFRELGGVGWLYVGVIV